MYMQRVCHMCVVARDITNSNATLILSELCFPAVTCHRVDISERVTVNPLHRYVNITNGDLTEVSPEHTE